MLLTYKRQCALCKNEKTYRELTKNKSKKCGVNSWCLVCNVARRRILNIQKKPFYLMMMRDLKHIKQIEFKSPYNHYA